ncbi:hypothetical protein B0T18DRAFT_398080 [Schizothecium vesticola]|uniref:Uncharacterized protein n=1 Tax=Schizothecium vesticola TaxID=314040 RepID=A0AA40KCL4_9PEZI|nr:hypothetical protein B0T18DRAFT_398080 [Schizothecium vesticola]
MRSNSSFRVPLHVPEPACYALESWSSPAFYALGFFFPSSPSCPHFLHFMRSILLSSFHSPCPLGLPSRAFYAPGLGGLQPPNLLIPALRQPSSSHQALLHDAFYASPGLLGLFLLFIAAAMTLQVGRQCDWGSRSLKRCMYHGCLAVIRICLDFANLRASDVGWRRLWVPTARPRKSVRYEFGLLDAWLGWGCLWLLPQSSLG